MTTSEQELSGAQGVHLNEQVEDPLHRMMSITVSEYIDLRTRADRYEAVAEERGTALEDLRRMSMALESAEGPEARKSGDGGSEISVSDPGMRQFRPSSGFSERFVLVMPHSVHLNRFDVRDLKFNSCLLNQLAQDLSY